MKPQKFKQKLSTGKWVETVGYPCPLPKFPTQFAIVRPPSITLEDWQEWSANGWQVIHLASGLRLSRHRGESKTRADAKRSAMAEIERVIKLKGWRWVKHTLEAKA